MSGARVRDDALWRSAPPLWEVGGPDVVAADRPAILRFAGDDFMDQFHAAVAERASQLPDLLAANETWRDPAAGLAAATIDATPLKLFQPVHGRFYLVAASLVCARYWLPDKRIDPTCGESVFFVMRQLRPLSPSADMDPSDPSTYVEMAWVGTGNAGTWEPAGATVVSGEQRLPLFALSYQSGTGPRRLFAGLIPVSAREAYESGRGVVLPSPDPTDPMASVTDPRLARLATTIGGLQALAAAAGAGHATDADLRESLFFALLDLAAWIKDALPQMWEQAAAVEHDVGTLAVRLLSKDSFKPGVTWLEALKTADAGASAAGTDPEPVAGMSPADIAAAVAAVGVTRSPTAHPETTQLFSLAAAALETVKADRRSGDASVAEAADAEFAGPVSYVLRCVYERPCCSDAHRFTIGRASRPFVLAQFFDPDAPFRPARIPTPVDVSLAALRKHPKSVTVTISNQLRAQMERVQAMSLSDLDSGNIAPAPSLSLGMVCQLSIPIITICALILLMIIVQLLNLVFWWLPFFKICLPKVEVE